MIYLIDVQILNHSLGHFIDNDPILSQMPNVALAFHVLSELYDTKSFWKPYLQALPSSYDTVMYFNPQEIAELKGSPAFGKLPYLSSIYRKSYIIRPHNSYYADDALKMCRNIARQYSYFYSLLQVYISKLDFWLKTR